MRSSIQRHNCQVSFPQQAFTLVELLAVICTVCLLACFMLPVLARAKIKSPADMCLSNLRQMQLGANMYRDDNNDVLIPNAPAGVSPGSGWVASNPEDWHTASPNTNVSYYAGGLLWPYVNRDISVYRCPADFKFSDNGSRLRSRSMNGMMGLAQNSTYASYNPGWKMYQKGSDFTCPAPRSAWIFCDESMYSLNDGYLQISSTTPQYPDVPAAYHAGACGFSFADGHVEIHRWLGSKLAGVPYSYGVQNNGTITATTFTDVDWAWLTQHAACRVGQ